MTKDSGCSWQSLVKINSSTQAEEKEQEKSCSGKQWEGQENTQSSAQGNPPDTCQCPARGDAEGYLADAEAHTHCPASAAAGLITFGERHNYCQLQLLSWNSTTF